MDASDALPSDLTRIGLIGDVHMQKTPLTKRALPYFASHGISHVVQVGDFGLYPKFEIVDGFNPNFLDEVEEESRQLDINMVFSDGNHDSRDVLQHYCRQDDGPFVGIRDHITYARRGSRANVNGVELLFLGGAISIDDDKREQQLRRMYNPGEGITIADVDRAIARDTRKKWSRGKPADVLLSHDGLANLDWAAMHEAVGRPYNRDDFQSVYNRRLLQLVADETGVECHVHGHFHFQHESVTPEGVKSYGLSANDKPGLMAILDLSSGRPVVTPVAA